MTASSDQVIAQPVEKDPDHLVDDLDRALGRANSGFDDLKRADVPKELLGRVNDTNLVRYTLTDWFWIGIFWVGMTLSSPVFYPVWVLLIAGRIHSFGVILHDAAHKNINSKNWKIRFVEIFAGYPMASTLNAMRYHHIRHHRDSGMANDPYFKPSLENSRIAFWAIWARHILLMPFWMIRGFYGTAAFFFPRLRNSYARIFLQLKSKEDVSRQKELIDCARAEIGQACVHSSILVVTAIYPATVVFYYFIPGLVAGLLGGYRVLTEHNYIRASDRSLKTIFETTVDHNLGPLGRLFWAPRNIGYHIVHHLHPQVALENLPALRSWYLDNYPDKYPRPYANGTCSRVLY